MCNKCVNGQLIYYSIENVIYVPNLGLNLLSVVLIEKSSLKVIFVTYNAKIIQGSKVIAVGVCKGNLYQIKLKIRFTYVYK